MPQLIWQLVPQAPAQSPLHEPEQLFVQELAQPFMQLLLGSFLQDCNAVGATVASTAIPKMGKVFLPLP